VVKKTIAEKIISAHCSKPVSAGDTVVASVDLAMATDGSGPLTIQLFREMGHSKVWDPEKVLMVLDHYVPCPNDKVAGLQDGMRSFCNDGNGVLFDLGEGICHQLLPEKGYIRPGSLVVGADSHSLTYGALNALGTGIGSSDLAAVMATGKLWLRVPESVKVIINGQMPPHVTAKDIALFIVGRFGAGGANYRALEFHGDAVPGLDMDDRMTLCNMMVETGSKCSIMPFDPIIETWARPFKWKTMNPVYSDPGAVYADTLEVNLDRLTPQIAKPHQVDRVTPIAEVENIPIQMVVIGTCTNGRLKDLRSAAELIDGRGKAPGVELLIVPASRKIYLEASREGILDIFVRNGALVLPPGCGPCCGSSAGIPGSGKSVLSTANRNFLGRMGNVKSSIYLGSPLSAAAAAVTGKITDSKNLN
jgi:3-isopropylmalate/(R)-2-methylmalate dehydratase large subunit